MKRLEPRGEAAYIQNVEPFRAVRVHVGISVEFRFSPSEGTEHPPSRMNSINTNVTAHLWMNGDCCGLSPESCPSLRLKLTL